MNVLRSMMYESNMKRTYWNKYSHTNIHFDHFIQFVFVRTAWKACDGEKKTLPYFIIGCKPEIFGINSHEWNLKRRMLGNFYHIVLVYFTLSKGIAKKRQIVGLYFREKSKNGNVQYIIYQICSYQNITWSTYCNPCVN